MSENSDTFDLCNRKPNFQDFVRTKSRCERFLKHHNQKQALSQHLFIITTPRSTNLATLPEEDLGQQTLG